MKINFREWVKDKISLGEAMTWANPRNEKQKNYRIDIDQIQHYIQSEMDKNPNFDPVQGLSNIAANANLWNSPDFHAGEQPLNWKLHRLLNHWGFNDQDQFYFWWERGGRDIITSIRDKIRSKQKFNY